MIEDADLPKDLERDIPGELIFEQTLPKVGSPKVIKLKDGSRTSFRTRFRFSKPKSNTPTKYQPGGLSDTWCIRSQGNLESQGIEKWVRESHGI